MKAAGIMTYNGQFISAIISGDSVRVFRSDSRDHLLEVLSVSRPEIVGIERGSEDLDDFLKYSFNTMFLDKGVLEDDGRASKLIRLNIMKSHEEAAILLALVASDRLKERQAKGQRLFPP